MPNSPKKVSRPWVHERQSFERERTADDFDYNGRKWRNIRRLFLDENMLCIDCEGEGVVEVATVADHEPSAKELIRTGRDPYDKKYLRPLCKKHHDAKSGRERHGRKGDRGVNP